MHRINYTCFKRCTLYTDVNLSQKQRIHISGGLLLNYFVSMWLPLLSFIWIDNGSVA